MVGSGARIGEVEEFVGAGVDAVLGEFVAPGPWGFGGGVGNDGSTRTAETRLVGSSAFDSSDLNQAAGFAQRQRFGFSSEFSAGLGAGSILGSFSGPNHLVGLARSQNPRFSAGSVFFWAETGRTREVLVAGFAAPGEVREAISMGLVSGVAGARGSSRRSVAIASGGLSSTTSKAICGGIGGISLVSREVPMAAVGVMGGVAAAVAGAGWMRVTGEVTEVVIGTRTGAGPWPPPAVSGFGFGSGAGEPGVPGWEELPGAAVAARSTLAGEGASGVGIGTGVRSAVTREALAAGSVGMAGAGRPSWEAIVGAGGVVVLVAGAGGTGEVVAARVRAGVVGRSEPGEVGVEAVRGGAALVGDPGRSTSARRGGERGWAGALVGVGVPGVTAAVGGLVRGPVWGG